MDNAVYAREPIEYQKDPAIVTIQPMTLFTLRGCLNTITEMMIMQTCLMFPAMLMTRGDVDLVASKLATFSANAVNPLKRNSK